MAEVKAEPKIKNCNKQVKDDDGKQHACGTVIPKGQTECKNRKAHILPFVTGFCSAGFCEGKKARDFTGKPVKTCAFWKTCPCKCHVQIDKMCLMTNMPRIPLENPLYQRPVSPYVMPRPEERFEQLAAEDSKPVEPVKRSPLEVKPVRFEETPSGKRARGQLEMQVLEVCSNFVKGLLEVEDLTPHAIANEIDEIDPPSVGAIGAVFDRWVALGFARCEKKPVRFVSFTVEGMMNGLDYMKAKAKREKKMQQAEQSRGKLRPRNG